jgi:hypothetical protein
LTVIVVLEEFLCAQVPPDGRQLVNKLASSFGPKGKDKEKTYDKHPLFFFFLYTHLPARVRDTAGAISQIAVPP